MVHTASAEEDTIVVTKEAVPVQAIKKKAKATSARASIAAFVTATVVVHSAPKVCWLSE